MIPISMSYCDLLQDSAERLDTGDYRVRFVFKDSPSRDNQAAVLEGNVEAHANQGVVI